MGWVLFVAGAVLSWGIYGSMLADGQRQLGNPLKALLCVGAAYFLVGVIVPVAALSAQGGLSNFNTGGAIAATIGGILGVILELGIFRPLRRREASGADCLCYRGTPCRGDLAS